MQYTTWGMGAYYHISTQYLFKKRRKKKTCMPLCFPRSVLEVSINKPWLIFTFKDIVYVVIVEAYSFSIIQGSGSVRDAIFCDDDVWVVVAVFDVVEQTSHAPRHHPQPFWPTSEYYSKLLKQFQDTTLLKTSSARWSWSARIGFIVAVRFSSDCYKTGFSGLEIYNLIFEPGDSEFETLG